MALVMTLFFIAGTAQAMTPEELAANQKAWPREVTITKKSTAKLFENGEAIGRRILHKGEKYKVTAVRPDVVSVSVGTETAEVPLENTNALSSAQSASGRDNGNEGKVDSASPVQSNELSPYGKKITGDLVTLSGNKLKAAPADVLKGVKYFGIYYSAHWCPPCRRFTPKLVSFYRKMKKKHPEFEMIFVSSDKSEKAMVEYMRDTRMKWPALAFDKKRSAKDLTKYSGRGIPCLVFLNANGKVLSDSYRNGKYVGPSTVMKDIDKTLANTSTAAR